MCVRDSEVLAVFLTGASIRPGRVSAALCAHSAFPAPAPSRPPDTALAEKSPRRPSIPPQDATLIYSVLVNEPFVEQLSVHSKVEWEVQRFRSHPHPLRHPASTICTPPPPSAPQLRCLHPVSAIHTPLHTWWPPMQPGDLHVTVAQRPRFASGPLLALHSVSFDDSDGACPPL